MGSHTNYYSLILSLIRIKDELYRVNSPILQQLINLLNTKNIEWVDDCEEVPSNKELAKEIGITVTKCNTYLKKLKKDLIESFVENPLQVNNVVCHVYISRHWRETDKLSNERKKEEYGRNFSLDVNLPVIPRIGEQIEFELADRNGYYHGTVYEIEHEIVGKKQRILIFVHPSETDYYRWMRLKQEYNLRGRNKYG